MITAWPAQSIRPSWSGRKREPGIREWMGLLALYQTESIRAEGMPESETVCDKYTKMRNLLSKGQGNGG